MFDKLNNVAYVLVMHEGERIKAVRELRRLSQGKLAKLSGVSKGTVSRSEKGDPNIELKTFKALALALRIPPSYLVDEQMWSKRTPRNILSKAALDAFLQQNQNISPRDRQSLLEALDNDIASPLEPAGPGSWEEFYRFMKFQQRRGPSLAELPIAAEQPRRYKSPTKAGALRRRKTPRN